MGAVDLALECEPAFDYGRARHVAAHRKRHGIFVLTGVPGRQAFVETDPARLMRDMVLKNQVLLGTVNAGPEAFASSLRKLALFRHRWPYAVQTLIAGRYPAERATELILGRPTGIKGRDRLWWAEDIRVAERDAVTRGLPHASLAGVAA